MSDGIRRELMKNGENGCMVRTHSVGQRITFHASLWLFGPLWRHGLLQVTLTIMVQILNMCWTEEDWATSNNWKAVQMLLDHWVPPAVWFLFGIPASTVSCASNTFLALLNSFLFPCNCFLYLLSILLSSLAMCYWSTLAWRMTNVQALHFSFLLSYIFMAPTSSSLQVSEVWAFWLSLLVCAFDFHHSTICHHVFSCL